MIQTEGKDIGRIIHQRRRTAKLTLQRLSSMSGVSPSHLARIERRERFPSARILRKIARPLDFDENELFVLAGYLSRHAESDSTGNYITGLDPYVASMLAQEPFRVQRAIVDIIGVLRGISEVPEKVIH